MSDSNIGGEASILEERRRKLEELREQNIAYINNFTPADQAQELHGLYGHINKEELEEKKISDLSIAGRIVLKRVMGNASFVTIRDGSGDIQAYISKNNIDPDLYKNNKENNPMHEYQNAPPKQEAQHFTIILSFYFLIF